MQPSDHNYRITSALEERQKEIAFLHDFEDLLHDQTLLKEDVFLIVIKRMQKAWQFPDLCEVRLRYRDKTYETGGYVEEMPHLSVDLIAGEKIVGDIQVTYTNSVAKGEIGPFLKQEKRLLDTIAFRLGDFILNYRLKKKLEKKKVEEAVKDKTEWRIVVDMIRKTDPALFMRLLRKMLHQLNWKGIQEAEALLKELSIDLKGDEERETEDENRPLQKRIIHDYDSYINAILKLTSENFTEEEILWRIQKWIQNDNTSALIKVLESQGSSLADISDAIRRFYHLAPEKIELSPATVKGLRVSLLRRFLTDDLDFIQIAKDYVKLTDFHKLIDKMIFMPGSHGKLGGKSSGVFLAHNILNSSVSNAELPFEVKVPKTWYLTSDCIMQFIQYNNLEEVYEHKYRDIEEIRVEYPQVLQLFKDSQFPPDVLKGLSVALDDFGDRPIIVRSSSLLEDQVGSAFSGKYKSLFLANQGSKSERLNALMDAIAEVYASTFGPDPIEYRTERGLIDFHEEMGIMIMEVVGTRVGDYFFPSFAGVAFSNNEFRWSPRINREDGLVRIVPGLGTRAVDRVSDDYPVLIAPGQPNLRVNVTFEESVRYSPKKIDLINLKTNQFQTIEIDNLIKEVGIDYPQINNIVSVVSNGMLRPPNPLQVDYQDDDFVVTFNGLLSKTQFIQKMHSILQILEAKFGVPVDIEFASDGKDFYLLQCRPQSYSGQNTADVIPKNIPSESILFSATKHISNGKVPPVRFVVYVDPEGYDKLKTKEEMLEVATVIGKLNKMLPRKKFILMGPGRWGSRGDIKLGVSITYSQINNTAMLIEIAKQKGNYKPDLSFGTHFFQDLVEASIRYLPLFIDGGNSFLNESVITASNNLLIDMLPEHSHLKDVVYILDIENEYDGGVLKVLMSAEEEIALAVIMPEGYKEMETVEDNNSPSFKSLGENIKFNRIAKFIERLSIKLDKEKYRIESIFFLPPVHAMEADQMSPVLLIKTDASEEMLNNLSAYLNVWNDCLHTLEHRNDEREEEKAFEYILSDDIDGYLREYIEAGSYMINQLYPLKSDFLD